MFMEDIMTPKSTWKSLLHAGTFISTKYPVYFIAPMIEIIEGNMWLGNLQHMCTSKWPWQMSVNCLFGWIQIMKAFLYFVTPWEQPWRFWVRSMINAAKRILYSSSQNPFLNPWENTSDMYNNMHLLLEYPLTLVVLKVRQGVVWMVHSWEKKVFKTTWKFPQRACQGCTLMKRSLNHHSNIVKGIILKVPY